MKFAIKLGLILLILAYLSNLLLVLDAAANPTTPPINFIAYTAASTLIAIAFAAILIRIHQRTKQ